MSKKTEEKSTDLAKAPQSQMVANLTQQANQTALMSAKDQLKALEESLGIDSADIEVIAAGKLPFWPAFAGAVLIGTVMSRREVTTQYKSPQNPTGAVGIYTVRVEQRPCLSGTLDGEISELNPGENITVLERTVLKELQTRIGQQVAILCVGKVPGKSFSYWDYKIVGKRRSPEQIQAASMQAMANLQMKQLGSGSAGE